MVSFLGDLRYCDPEDFELLGVPLASITVAREASIPLVRLKEKEKQHGFRQTIV